MSANANDNATPSDSDTAFDEKAAQNDALIANDQQEDGGKQREKHEQDGQQQQDTTHKNEEGPEGGYDATPIPARPPGYTVKFTFLRATNLVAADLYRNSSDPYVLAQINTDVPTRHKEDPPLRFRTPTIQGTTDPEWNEEWTVANVPASGCILKLRLYDEDANDRDDRLGNVHISIPALQGWGGIQQQSFEIKARSGSKRAYAIRMVAVCFSRAKHIRGHLFVSAEVVGRTEEDGQSGRLYTAGPCRWARHYDPILGRLANIKEPDNDDEGDEPKSQQQEKAQQKQHNPDSSNKSLDAKDEKKKVQQYNFQANEFQLQGPVPAKLYHRYVEFKPWVKRMFTSTGLTGMVLGKALHHQHSRVYNFDRQTVWGHLPAGPNTEMTQKFLDLVHWDKGGRIFTYVLTLDALWRFTETGKEFGIDMLSKHTMHSDVSIYIAFSGEFFIRRLKHAHRPEPPDPVDDTSHDHPPAHGSNPTSPPADFGDESEEGPTDPRRYQLVIDNDSGTYRPNAALLPLLKEFLARSLPGLHIQTLDCQDDADKMARMKGEQRDRKAKAGDQVVYTQGSRSSSISSSDEEDLDRIEGGGQPNHLGDGLLGQVGRDMELRGKARVAKAKRNYAGGSRSRSAQPSEEVS
ncbi:hypothetical protein LTR08_008218 [Meristemomyces frigidus]|nr:hypothetical protein LTR08_008218 [Meristemomyces frigidus]